MNTNPRPIRDIAAGGRRGLAVRKLLGALVVLAVVAGGAAAVVLSNGRGGSSSAVSTDSAATFQVKRGPLTISVIEAGTIRSSQAVTLKCEVEGRTSILSLVEEGKAVKQGDVLVELDSSSLMDQKVEQEIRLKNAEAAFIQARESLEIMKQQAQADISEAQLAYRFAKEDVEKYKEGEFPQEREKAITDIKIAEAELKRATDTYEWSKRLFDEGYVTETDLQKDEITHQKAVVELSLKQGALKLLEDYNHKRMVAQLEEDVKQKEFLLRKTEHSSNSNIVEAQARLDAAEATYKREQEKLTKLIDQIAKCKIVSPVDGMVVYATSGRSRFSRSDEEPLAEGVEVRERQELIRLPTTSEMLADVRIHESALEKIRVGLPVRITIEALPGRTFTGRVDKISVLPDASSMYMNPDLKVYPTTIQLQGDMTDLRPGMSCRAELIVDHYDDALHVPVQSVLQVGGKPTVYVPGSTGPQAQQVKVGLDNTRMIRILEGLQEGDRVLLAPPLPPSTVVDGGLGEQDRFQLDALKNQVPIIEPSAGGSDEQAAQTKQRNKKNTQGKARPSPDAPGPQPDSGA